MLIKRTHFQLRLTFLSRGLDGYRLTKQDLGEEGKHSRTVRGWGGGAEVKERCLFRIGQRSQASSLEPRGGVQQEEQRTQEAPGPRGRRMFQSFRDTGSQKGALFREIAS